MHSSPRESSLASRRYDIDALRVLAFSLLILYHVGMLYVADWGWHIKSPYTTSVLQIPMFVVNRWRMSLLFLLSGIAVGLYQPETRSWKFALSRTLRLLIPLVFAMFTTVTIQAYCQGVTNKLVEPGYLNFLRSYWSIHPWPQNAFDGWEHGITWNHLWYLPYLWVYTIVLLALLPVLKSSPIKKVRHWLTHQHSWIMIIPAIPVSFMFAFLWDRFPPTHDLLNDWCNHAVYFTVFLYGYWVADDETFWNSVVRQRGKHLIIAIAICGLYVPAIFNDKLSHLEPVKHLHPFMWSFYMWSAAFAILGYGRRYLNRPSALLRYATEAVFPWYILHQTLIVLIAYWIVPLKFGGAIESLIVIAGTLFGCYALHHYIIRRTIVLRPLFGLKMTGSS